MQSRTKIAALEEDDACSESMDGDGQAPLCKQVDMPPRGDDGGVHLTHQSALALHKDFISFIPCTDHFRNHGHHAHTPCWGSRWPLVLPLKCEQYFW